METQEYEKMRSVEDTHWWYVGLHELLERYAASERSREGRISILDAGCGTGRLCEVFSRHGDIRGIDASPVALHHCRARGLSGVAEGDLSTADLGSERYHLISCIDVLCHRWVPDVGQVLRRFHRALRPGGLLIVQVPALRALAGPHDRPVMTRRRFDREELRTGLSRAGFDVERVTYRLALMFPLIAPYRFWRRLLERARPPTRELPSDVRPVSRPLNALFLGAVRLENQVIGKVPLPFGSSLIACARKPNPPLTPTVPPSPERD